MALVEIVDPDDQFDVDGWFARSAVDIRSSHGADLRIVTNKREVRRVGISFVADHREGKDADVDVGDNVEVVGGDPLWRVLTLMVWARLGRRGIASGPACGTGARAQALLAGDVAPVTGGVQQVP